MTDITLPLVALRDAVLFPRVLMPLAVGRPSSVKAIEAAVASEHKTLLVAVQRDAAVEEPTLADLAPFATRAVIKRVERHGELVQAVLQGIDRVRLLGLEPGTPHPLWRAEVLPELTGSGAEVEALQRNVVEVARNIAVHWAPATQALLLQVADDARDPVHQAYLLAGVLELPAVKAVELLGAGDRAELLRTLLAALQHELNVLRLRDQIADKTKAELDDQQRRFVLRQQLQQIRRELGEDEGDTAGIEDLRTRLAGIPLPERARAEADRELQRLERIPTASAEHQIVRSWLELVAELPWQTPPAPAVDLAHARAVLDADHFGLPDVKERIVEHLAVLKLNPTSHAPILCLVGPPGVGKTSLGQSIARALGRRFERVSLGGLHDEAELRGHRRTYVGAMPGRVVQAIRRAGAGDPVLMLDEVDKLGVGVHGDPAAALLEILDPAQNGTFEDNYLGLPFDLSRVFFVTTANTLDTIARPLLDRMEVVRIPGYTEDEKLAIGRDHLLPRQRRECGLEPRHVTLPDDVLRLVVRRYTREAGVRQLDRALGTLCRKVAARVAADGAASVPVQEPSLRELLGPERFHEEELRRELVPGVAPGLAWTEAGGSVLYVESVLLPQSAELVLTGQLGDVMRESARTAASWVRSHARELGITIPPAGGVHLHVPAGATPKDGPSAGVAMATALASLFAGVPARGDVAMTGEITLSGLVLPVGGIREKLLAAHRAGMRAVVIPARNADDVHELPASAREGLRIHLAAHVEDVLAVALPGLGVKATSTSATSAGAPPQAAAGHSD